MNSTLGSVVPLAMFLYNQVDGEAFVTPKEALKRKEFYMLWVTRSQTPPFSSFYFKCVSQVLCRPDHSVCVRLLQSVRPKLYRGRSFPVFCRSGELCLQLHWKAFLWHSHGQVQNILVNIHKNILKDRSKNIFISRWSSQISGQATAQRWGWRWCSWPPWWPPSPPPRSLARWDTHKCKSETSIPLETIFFSTS